MGAPANARTLTKGLRRQALREARQRRLGIRLVLDTYGLPYVVVNETGRKSKRARDRVRQG